MEKELKLKSPVAFKSINVTANRVVTLKVTMSFSEMITSVNLLTGLNSDINIVAKIGDRKPCNLGTFTIGSVSFDRDGNATIPFKALVEHVNLNNITDMIGEEYIQLRFKALLELPDNSEDEETEDDGMVESDGRWVENE